MQWDLLYSLNASFSVEQEARIKNGSRKNVRQKVTIIKKLINSDSKSK